MPRETAPGLFEREAELLTLDAVVQEAASGSGRVVVIEGPAGIGKTALLTHLRARVGELGWDVLFARAGELEAGLTFGLIRQLLEPHFAGVESTHFDDVTTWAPRPGESLAGGVRVLVPRPACPPPGPDGPGEFAVFQDLHTLVVRLASRKPVLIAVDDAHWADPASLRWVIYLSRRIERLPVLVAVTVRTCERGQQEDLLLRLTADPSSVILRPAPLSEATVTLLVRALSFPEADEEFCRACHTAAGGNPFFVREVIRTAAAQGIAPRASQAGLIGRLRPDGIASALALRLQRLPASASRAARAVAVLSHRAELRLVAELAEIDPQEASLAADALAAAGVLRPVRPLEFVHPVIRSVVYHRIPAGERSLLHKSAAPLLSGEGAPVDAVATHLLETEPQGDPWVVEALHRAAEAERAPERTAAYLRRALVEPPPDAGRARLLLELGTAESAEGSPLAIEHLSEALDLAADPVERARAAHLLGRSLWLLDRREEAARAYQRARQEVAGASTEAGYNVLLEIEAECARCQGVAGWSADELERLRTLAGPGDTPGRRALLGTLAYIATFAGFRAVEVETLARGALAGGNLFVERADAITCFYPVWALEWADRLEAAEEHAASMLRQARQRGWPSRETIAWSIQAEVSYRRAALAEAEAAGRRSLELTVELGFEFMVPVAVAVVTDVLVEQGRHGEAEKLVMGTDIDATRTTKSASAMFLHSRGLLRLAAGRVEEALEDFLTCGDLVARSAHDHPAYRPWRSSAALAHERLGNNAEAKRLVGEELEMARRYQAPGVLGAALRNYALTEKGDRQLELLTEAAAVLHRSQSVLERIRALVDLGAALRRQGHRVAARDPLRVGLDLAHRCGAAVLADRACHELTAAGGRPRRTALLGIDALTPSEERVARMVAEGRSNTEIARLLFISVKTVEKHLGRAYQKLGVNARGKLAEFFSAKPS